MDMRQSSAQAGLRTHVMRVRGASNLQIGSIAGDLTVITSSVGHAPSLENCSACPVRCCSHRAQSHNVRGSSSEEI